MKMLSTFLYGFYISFHPFDGFYELKHRRKKSFHAAIFIFILTIIIQLASVFLTHPLFSIVVGGRQNINVLQLIFTYAAPVLIWSVIAWSITTIFDGKATMKQIFTSTCFSLYPLLILQIIQIIISYVFTQNEGAFYYLLGTVSTIWVVFLVLTGMSVIQDYTMSKSIIVAICVLIGIVFFCFIAFVFYSTIQQFINFFVTIITEIYYWISQ